MSRSRGSTEAILPPSAAGGGAIRCTDDCRASTLSANLPRYLQGRSKQQRVDDQILQQVVVDVVGKEREERKARAASDRVAERGLTTW